MAASGFVVILSSVWVGCNWGNSFLFAAGEAASSAMLVIKLCHFSSYGVSYSVAEKYI